MTSAKDRRLSNFANTRDNNFNLMRFVAASLVLFSHSFAIALGSSDFEPMKLTLNVTWGSIAVDIFFITSGFLIAKSFLFSKDLLSFAWARFIRIYPALLVIIALTIFLLGPIFTEISLYEYFSDKQTLKHLIKNSVLIFGIEYRLPGVFLENPSGSAINGSLWTLPYEVKMYFIMACTLTLSLWVNRKLAFVTPKKIILLISVAALCLHFSNNFFEFTRSNFIRLFTMFFIGSCFYLFKERIVLSTKLTCVSVVALGISTLDKDAFFVIYYLALPYLVFYLAYIPEGKVRLFNNIGDYSYGIYIYAFPVQQVFAAIIPGISVIEMIVFSFIGTIILAALSWHFVEKYCLKLKGNPFFLNKKRYRNVTA